MDLKEIIEQGAQYTRDSGFTVRINKSMSYVSVEPVEYVSDEDEEEEAIFLVGEDADAFINRVEQFADDSGLDEQTVAEHLAKQLIESTL